MSNARVLAEFVEALRYEDLPPLVVDKVKQLVMNTLGNALACSTLPWCQLVVRETLHEGMRPAESTVVNSGIRAPAADAALVNGTFAYGFEMDDNHARTGIKGGCITIPAALAIGEVENSTGKDLITAVAAAYEVITRIGLAGWRGMWRRGIIATGAVGAVAAATVAGKLAGLGTEELTHALCSAGVHVVSSTDIPEHGRGHLKRIFGGVAAANGLRAVRFAAAGLTGPDTTFDDRYGFCRSFDVDPNDVALITAGLGHQWEILDVHFKVYAQDGFIQPMTEALQNIIRDHSIDPGEVEEVRVGTNRRALNEIVGPIRDPKDLTDAQYSARFSLALFLITGGAGFHEYTEENLNHPAIRAMSRRVMLEVDEEIDQEYATSRPRGARVSVLMKNGMTHRSKVANLRAMTQHDLDTKFERLAGEVLETGAVTALHRQLHGLENLSSTTQLAPLLVASKMSGRLCSSPRLSSSGK